jgi:hypothetical protein
MDLTAIGMLFHVKLHVAAYFARHARLQAFKAAALGGMAGDAGYLGRFEMQRPGFCQLQAYSL